MSRIDDWVTALARLGALAVHGAIVAQSSRVELEVRRTCFLLLAEDLFSKDAKVKNKRLHHAVTHDPLDRVIGRVRTALSNTPLLFSEDTGAWLDEADRFRATRNKYAHLAIAFRDGTDPVSVSVRDADLYEPLFGSAEGFDTEGAETDIRTILEFGDRQPPSRLSILSETADNGEPVPRGGQLLVTTMTGDLVTEVHRGGAYKVAIRQPEGGAS
jgi:hypothetical protein